MFGLGAREAVMAALGPSGSTAARRGFGAPALAADLMTALDLALTGSADGVHPVLQGERIVLEPAAADPGFEAGWAAAVFRAAAKVARAIRAAFEPQGLSVYQANGAAAGQTVFHLHIHLVPRYEGDGMALTWPVKNPPREKLADYAEQIRAKLG